MIFQKVTKHKCSLPGVQLSTKQIWEIIVEKALVLLPDENVDFQFQVDTSHNQNIKIHFHRVCLMRMIETCLVFLNSFCFCYLFNLWLIPTC